MAVFLTQNAILTLINGDVDLRPLVQILDVRQVGNGESVKKRYRLVLSDGVYLYPAFLCKQLNDFAESGKIQRGSIVKLIEYIFDTVQNRKIIIVFSMEVAVSEAEIIGDPQRVLMNAHTLAAPTASNLRQPQHTLAMQATSAAPQPQLPGNSGSYGGYKAGPSLKEASYYSAAPKPAQPVGYQGPAYASGVNAQASGGAGIYSNRPPSAHCHQVTAPPYQPTPLYSNHEPILKNEAPARIVPIAALNPYQGRWTIKARVTAKGELRQFKNDKGEGKVFNFVLLDAEGGEICMNCFNNVADQLYDRTEVGKVYILSKGSIKPAKRTFNHLKSGWEIYLETTSTVEPCYEDDGSIPHQMFNFKPIREIQNMEANSMVDLIGVVVKIKPTVTIMRKNGTPTQKRSLQLLDISGGSVDVTIWGTFCNNEGQQLQDLCVSGQFPVLAFKAGRISAKSVGTIPLSQLLINPNLPQAFEVKEWFEQLGRTTASKSVRKQGAGGAPGGKAMVEDHRVRAKSAQTQITTFFQPLIENSLMKSTPSKTIKPRPLIAKTSLRKGALPRAELIWRDY